MINGLAPSAIFLVRASSKVSMATGDSTYARKTADTTILSPAKAIGVAHGIRPDTDQNEHSD